MLSRGSLMLSGGLFTAEADVVLSWSEKDQELFQSLTLVNGNKCEFFYNNFASIRTLSEAKIKWFKKNSCKKPDAYLNLLLQAVLDYAEDELPQGELVYDKLSSYYQDELLKGRLNGIKAAALARVPKDEQYLFEKFNMSIEVDTALFIAIVDMYLASDPKIRGMKAFVHRASLALKKCAMEDDEGDDVTQQIDIDEQRLIAFLDSHL